MGHALFCRVATVFGRDGRVDEPEYRKYLQRVIDQGIGLCPGTGGVGEGHTMSMDELRRAYTIVVDACRGKVPVCANPPEQHTADMTIEHSRLAADCGVDVVNVYQAAAWHEFKATEAEHRVFFDRVLDAVRHPVQLAPIPPIGSVPSAGLLADLCNRHRHVRSLSLVALSPTYILDVKRRLNREVPVYVTTRGSIDMMALGIGAGIIGPEMNIIPATYRTFMDHFDDRRIEATGRIYADLLGFIEAIARWTGHSARPIKMAMKVLKLPGGEGGLREPSVMPDEAELAEFSRRLVALRIPEITELAHRAGLVSAA